MASSTVVLNNTVYQDVYAATGLPYGSAITISNTSSNPVYVQEVGIQPVVGSVGPNIIQPGGTITFEDTPPGVWVFGLGTITVLTQSTSASSVSVTPSAISSIDRSGSVSVGGTSQLLTAANPGRKKIIIQNPSSAAYQGIGSSESLFINFGASATSAGGSIEITPGMVYESEFVGVPGDAIYVYAATTGHKFTAKEF